MTESEEKTIQEIKNSIRRLEELSFMDIELESIEEDEDSVLRYPKEEVFLDNIGLEKYSLIDLLKEYEKFLKETNVKLPLNLPSRQQLNALFNPQGENIEPWKNTFNNRQSHIKGLIDGAQYIINLNR